MALNRSVEKRKCKYSEAYFKPQMTHKRAIHKKVAAKYQNQVQ